MNDMYLHLMRSFFCVNSFLLLLPNSLNADVYWSQGSASARDGATFVYADNSAKLLWRRHLGDWIDKQGELYGSTSFSSTPIQDLDTSREVTLDMTALVKYWLNTPNSYHGVYLKELSGSGTAVFHASESNHPYSPVLAVHTSDNGVKKFEVVKDTSLSTTTHYSLGHFPTFKIETNNPILLAFNEQFLNLDSTKITKASLVMSTTDKQYGNVDIGVYAIAPLVSQSEVEFGIAKNYPNDRDLADHPDVIIAERFDMQQGIFNSNKSLTHLNNTSPHNNYRLVDINYRNDNYFKPLDGGALQIIFDPRTHFGFSGHYSFQELIGREPEQMYFRYYVRFSNDWHPIESGKLPGFSGTYNKAGWGGRAVDGYNGWSARGTFHLQASPNSKYNGAIPLGNYVYHMDSNSDYGEMVSWNSELNLLQKNRWYAIEQYLKLNDPGKANGELTVWIDGKKIFNRNDFRFRETSQLKIESLWLNFYHGGLDKPKTTFYVYIDNLVIATRYIGPMHTSDQLSLN